MGYAKSHAVPRGTACDMRVGKAINSIHTVTEATEDVKIKGYA